MVIPRSHELLRLPQTAGLLHLLNWCYLGACEGGGSYFTYEKISKSVVEVKT